MTDRKNGKRVLKLLCYSENIIYRISIWIPGTQIFSKDFNHRFSVNEDGLLYLHHEYVWMTEFRKKCIV